MTAPDHREANRRAAAVNELLRDIELSSGAESDWWNHRTYAELGGLTPTQAWLRDDHEAVRELIDGWYRASERTAERCRNDPEFMERLQERRAAIAERVKRTA
jgi:hypothetical protein